MWERVESACEAGAAARAAELRAAFNKLARWDKRQNIGARVAEGSWDKTKPYRKSKKCGGPCVHDDEGNMRDAKD